MKRIEIFAFIIIGLFYFSEGKPCPEKTRPHKTRCEAYYKCMQLSTQRHVWVPEKCEQGLIYEHNLRLCVLPGDDWECTLGDVVAEKETRMESSSNERQRTAALKAAAKEGDLYVVSNERIETPTIKEHVDDGNIEVIMESSISDEEDDEEQHNNANEIESSGDGGELVELDGFLQAENRETEDSQPTSDDAMEIEKKPANKSKVDPKLTAHLQRLSQLIDGLKQTYQSGDEKQTELRPDQLNAFLAHFNIQNKFNLIKPTVETGVKDASSTPQDTAAASAENSIHPELLLQQPSKNKTLLQEHLSSKLHPETKVVLTNGPSKHYPNSGYSNSQIVVNRPEGAVLFTLPSFDNNEQQHYLEHGAAEYGQNSPKISEETLKTVLELSKQMIATQNIPKVIPNPTYYAQPILQPYFLPAAAFPPQRHNNPYSPYYNGNNNNNNQNNDYDDGDGKYGQLSSVFSRPQSHHNKGSRPASGYTKPSTTIIHNNVIPVHVTSTNSGEKEVVDSYGHSIGLYPPLNADNGNSNGNGYQSQSINHHHLHSHNYDNKYIGSITTVRPVVSTTSSANYGGQYPSPYPTELSVTTPRPIDFQVSPATISEYYTPSPHLSEHNVNNLFQPTERYPTVQYGDIPRPMDLNRPAASHQAPLYHQTNLNSLFPAQLDPSKVKIRPNAHKVESMEVEADDPSVSIYGEPQQQLLTYNYNNDKLDLDRHYMNPVYSSYTDSSSSSSSSSHKHPYMPRPQSGGGSGGTHSSYSSSVGGAFNSNKPKFPAFADGAQLVNVGGNFISFDVFQNTLLPLLGPSQSINELNNVEVITCAAGVRQPNMTDCTRYYVCSKKDGKVLSYSCPPYTAFNAQTRICDAQTYSMCSPDAIVSSYTVSENKRIQLEAIKALQDAKRRHEQALKSQNIANLLQQYSGGQLHSSNGAEDGESDSNEKDMLSSYAQQAAAMAAFSTTVRPSATAVKKRKYYCKEGDKIADQTSINSYFVCYKNAQGMMKGHKMTCSKGLLFCPKTTMCTLPAKCN